MIAIPACPECASFLCGCSDILWTGLNLPSASADNVDTIRIDAFDAQAQLGFAVGTDTNNFSHAVQIGGPLA